MSFDSVQTRIQVRAPRRGFHLITDRVQSALSELPQLSSGLCHVFIQHTSASLSLNENADPDVRVDMESIFTHLVPENEPYYTHTTEGPDDMPAHAKSSIIGASVTVPVRNGRLALGTWQGIYLCEHRDRPRDRSLIITLIGRRE